MMKTFYSKHIALFLMLAWGAQAASAGNHAGLRCKTVAPSIVGKQQKADDEAAFIDHLMGRMTLKEKIGQLSQYVGDDLLTGPQSRSLSDSLLKEGMVGSILNVGGVEKIRRIQERNMRLSRLKIPILFAFDVIHGYKTIFPTPLAESSSWDLDLMQRTAKAAAVEASASGIHWTFAPMVDIARDPRWGRIVEGAGEDTYLGCRIAEARVKGFQWNLGQPNSVLACAKHFAAYGAPQAGRDYAPVDMSTATLAENYLPPYKACVDAGVETFMSAFNDLNGTPCSGSKWLLTDLLRKCWGFGGFVVSDWNAVAQLETQGVVGDAAGAAVMALNAGLDMDMTDGLYNVHIAKAVGEGKVSMQTIDASVRRILRAKYRLGLFDDPYRFLDAKRERREVRNEGMMKLTREAACKSMVLLQNDRQLLPLGRQHKKIALVGPLADDRNEPMGSWKAHGEAADVVTVLQGLRGKLGNEGDIRYARGCDFADPSKSGFEEALRVARQSDVVIAVLGEQALMSGESRSRAHISLPGVQEALLAALKSTGKPIVVVLMNGRPLTLGNVCRQADAVLEAWFPGTQGGNAVADVLFGDYNPSGKLTVSFPSFEGQIPNHYNYKRSGRPGDMEHGSTVRHIDLKNANLFPFGFGLSYTKFDYGPLQCPDRFDADGKLKVSVQVTNSGPMTGEETVQLYVADKVASMVRPVKELKAFRKVSVAKGQTVTVELEVDARALGFWTNDMDYVVEAGEFAIMLGPDSERLQTRTVTLDGPTARACRPPCAR